MKVYPPSTLRESVLICHVPVVVDSEWRSEPNGPMRRTFHSGPKPAKMTYVVPTQVVPMESSRSNGVKSSDALLNYFLLMLVNLGRKH